MNFPLLFSIIILATSCSHDPAPLKHSGYVVDKKTLVETSDVATQLIMQLGGKLKQEISTNGPASAINLCNIVASEIASSLSQQTGWQVGRVGTRVRNPKNEPNKWQQAALNAFTSSAARGNKFDQMETYSVATVNGKPMLRYAKAISMQPMCLVCHGKPEEIPADVKARLQEKYPDDRAVGYSVGELRGAVVIFRPL